MKFYNLSLFCIFCLLFITSQGYSLLSRGSKGQEVLDLQEKLISLGYSCGPTGADGDYGSYTVCCVYAFQQVNKLDMDGIAGNQTQTILYSDDAQRNIVNGDETSSTLITLLSRGDKGASVKRAQLRLMLLGYDCGKTGADGIFGKNTKKCVKAFQINNHLPSTGSIDESTHTKLFSKSAINVKKMPESSLTRFVNTALGEYNYVGNEMDDGKYTKFGAWYGVNPGEWCAMFISWVASESRTIADHIIAKAAAVRILKEQFIDNNRFGDKESYIPQYGDILFITNNNQSHVAIVVGVTKNDVYTIEGNHGNKVDAVKRSLNNTSISGYGKNNSKSSGYVININKLN